MSDVHGRFGWNELMTRDIDEAKKFYAEVIGWTPTEVSMENPMTPAKEGEASYTLWMNGEDPSGGAMKMQGPEFDNVPSHWLSYVTVEDVDKAVAKAAELGGKVIAGPIEVKSVGRIFIVQDPQGAVLGLMTSAMEDNC